MKRRHTTWLTLLAPASTTGGRFLLAPLMQVIFNVWSVKAEYTADQGGLIAGGDVEGACLALLKLAGGPDTVRQVDPVTVREHTQDGGLLAAFAEYLGDHPFIRNRVAHLVNYAESRGFREACWWARP
jgi:Zn-dependent protease with chaperone function